MSKGPLPKDLSLQRFGNLVVVSFAGYGPSKTVKKDRLWLCKCDCGNEKIIRTQSLKRGLSKTCGIPGCIYRGKYKVASREEKQKASIHAIVYNLFPNEYEKISDFQNGVCAITGKPPAKIALAIDHDHKTGLVRGLLAWNVNKALAAFNDDPILLRKAADYLENPPATAALGESVYGMMGKAQKSKKKRKYGPYGTKYRQLRIPKN